jgi:S1-C subfamily serine protease
MLESGTPAATGSAAFDEGVIVTEVAEGSPGWQSGLRAGMLITHVGRTAVHNPGQFREIAGAHAGPVELRMANNPQNPMVTVAP